MNYENSSLFLSGANLPQAPLPQNFYKEVGHHQAGGDRSDMEPIFYGQKGINIFAGSLVKVAVRPPINE